MHTQAILFACHLISFTYIEILPTIVHFKKSFLQVREEEEEFVLCLVRERNLYREDTVTVITLPGEEENLLTASRL